MKYDQFSSDLPKEKAISFTSVEENQEVMARLGVDQDIKQLGRGKFRADMCVRDTQQAGLFCDRFSQAVSMYLEPPAGTAGFLIPRSASGKFFASGADVSNDQLVFVTDESGADIVAPDLIGSESFVIPIPRYIELTETLCPSMKPLGQMCTIRGDFSQLSELRWRILKLTTQQHEPDEELLSDLIASTITWMDISLNDYANEIFLLPVRKKKRIARSAQEYIHTNFREDVHIEDLCRATGVGVRTLQRSFREYFDLTITEYLKMVRLDAAQRELAAGAPSQFTVSNIALKNGFKHLGRFSVDFHDRFGLLPSEVLGTKH